MATNDHININIDIRPTEANRYDPFPNFQEPDRVGFFSLNTARKYANDASQLRFFKPPNNFPLDLNLGIDSAIKKPTTAADENLDHILNFISLHMHKLIPASEFPLKTPRLTAEFVSFRGLLKTIMCTPFNDREDWCIHATRFNGTIYLNLKETEASIYKRMNQNNLQIRQCAWGFKFEQYCLSDSPDEEPNTSVPVDESAEFACVFQTKIGDLKFLYAAEMDGIILDNSANTNTNWKHNKFIELKTRFGQMNQAQMNSFNRHQTRNWWCQSFLVGIKDIFVGLRTRDGCVHAIEHRTVRELARHAEHWSPAICTNFLINFCSRIKWNMSNVNHPQTVYEFYYCANSASIYTKIFDGKSENSFLPDWYIAQFITPKKPATTSALLNLNGYF